MFANGVTAEAPGNACRRGLKILPTALPRRSTILLWISFGNEAHNPSLFGQLLIDRTFCWVTDGRVRAVVSLRLNA
jgi:hypothetical protein